MKSNKKQIISILAVLTMALVLSCALVACNKTDSPDAPKKEFTITFDTQGGSEVKPITIAEGATITLPRNPTKEGYIFDGWFLSDEFIEKFNATQTISSNITVYAKWKEDYYSKGLNYELINDKREYAVAGIGTCTDKELIIPSEYNAKPVTSIGKDAFFHCTGLTSVTIPDSVTSIGYSAFDGCTGLTSVTIGGSVTSIGSYAFDGCSEIASISGSSDVISKVAKQSSPKSFVGNITSGTSVMAGAFSGMTGLTSVTIPDSVTSIGDDAFYGCNNLQDIYITDIVAWCYIAGLSSLMYNGASNKKLYINNELATSITLPDGVKAISSYAFYNCTGLTSITIPDSVTSIGYESFGGCKGLTSITIPDSVTSIGSSAFYGCSNLTSVTIGNGVTSIDNSAFYNTAWYNNQPDGVVYAGKVAYDYKGIMPINTSIVLKEGTLGIGDSAFYDSTRLTSITIPDSVTSIGNYAFSYCSGLTSVTIGNGVTSIGSYAFNGCTGLTSITIPDSVTSIGEVAFNGCSKLQDIYITDIAAWCNISGLYSLMGYSSSNKKLYINNKLATSITIPNGVTSIGNYAFSYCSGLTSVTIPNSVTSIGSYAFNGCTGLTRVTIPGSVTSIGAWSFGGCKGLTSITIPDSVTSIDDYAFWDCTGLTSITFKGTIEQWNAISKGSAWEYRVPATQVVCTDGTTSI